MWESASFVSDNSTDSINSQLAKAGMKKHWLDSINNFISKFAGTAKAQFGDEQLPNVIPINNKKG